MSTVIAYRLASTAPFHFGDEGKSETSGEMPRSDTIFSALLSAWATLGGDVAAWLPEQDAAPFVVSSGFPYAGPVHFLPLPQGWTSLGARGRYLSTGLMTHVLRQGVSVLAQAAHLHKGALLLTGEELAQLRATLPAGQTGSAPCLWADGAQGLLPRLRVSRLGDATELTMVGSVRFAAGCGPYFLIRYEHEAMRLPVETALDALADAGLGGMRSSGFGHFTWHAQPAVLGEGEDPAILYLPTAETPSNYLALALCHPRPDEVGALGDMGAAYQLIRRGGWCGQNQLRQAVLMLAEGSMLPTPLLGDIVDVRPSDFHAHPIYRAGMGFWLPLR